MNKHQFAFKLTLIPLLALFLFINVTVQANESTHQKETIGQKRPVDDKPKALVENRADLALPKDLASLIGLPEQEVEKWGRAIEALHTGNASGYSEQSSELFQKLSTLSDSQIDMFLSGDSPVSPGLRKTLEAVKYFGAKGIRDLEELGSGQTRLLGQVASSVLERKKADRAFLERARMIREGLTGLNTRLGQQKPNRAEMGELADARMSLRASIDQLLDQSGRHPESKEAIQAYRDALEAEKRILEHHRKIAVDRSQPTYWGNLGTELKRSYLSLDGAHRALGAVGMIPFLGEAADLIDGSLYLAEGKKVDASLSFAAMVPVAGIGVTAGRQTVRAARAVAGVGDAAVDLGRAARTTAHTVDAVADVGDAARAGARAVEIAGDARIARIDQGKQGKHIRGHNNFQEGRSEFTHSDPQGLLDKFSGKGVQHGHKEVVDFGEPIGYLVGADGRKVLTTRGTIHYDTRGGAHIVPAKPTTLIGNDL